MARARATLPSGVGRGSNEAYGSDVHLMPDSYNREERRRLTIQSASSPRNTAAAVLFTTYICIEVAVVIALVSGPTFQRVLALSDTQLGLCLGAVSLGTLMMSLVVGHATSRFGPFRVLLTDLTGMIFALGLIVLSQEFPALLAGLVLAGIAVASVHNAGLTLLAGIFPDNTRRIMALAAALCFSSSIVSAPLIGAWLAHAVPQSGQSGSAYEPVVGWTISATSASRRVSAARRRSHSKDCTPAERDLASF